MSTRICAVVSGLRAAMLGMSALGVMMASSAVAQPVPINTVARTGQAPGGFPAGSVFQFGFDRASVGRDGLSASFMGIAAGPGVSPANDSALFAGAGTYNSIAREGSLLAGATICLPEQWSSVQGEALRTLLSAGLCGGGVTPVDDRALFVLSFSPPALVARKGVSSLDTLEVLTSIGAPRLAPLPSGAPAWHSTLSSGAQSLLTIAPGGGFVELARSGPAPGEPGLTLTLPAAASDSEFAYDGQFAIIAGEVAGPTVTPGVNSARVYLRSSAGALSVLAADGAPVPNVIPPNQLFFDLTPAAPLVGGIAALNSGQWALLVGLQGPGAAPGSTAIVIRHAGLSVLLARTGQTSRQGETFGVQSRPMITASGRVYFKSTLVGGLTAEAIMSYSPGAIIGPITHALSAGDPLPGVPGITISGVELLAANNVDQIAVLCSLSGPGVGTNNDRALVVGRPGQFTTIMRTSDLIGVPQGVLTRIVVDSPSRGNGDGRASAFADTGLITAVVDLGNAQQAVVGAIAPGASGACCTGSSCSVLPKIYCTGARTRFAGFNTVCNAPGNNISPCCRADFNQMGGVSVQDIFDFLAAWFAGAAAADFNQTGGVSVQDIFDFLAAWFAGCPL